MRKDLNVYASAVLRCAGLNNGVELAPLLRKNSLSNFKRLSQQLSNLESQLDKADPEKIENFCASNLPSGWDKVVSGHLRSIISLKRQNYVEAYLQQLHAANEMLRIFADPAPRTGNLNPALEAINLDLRYIARLADRELRGKGQKEDKLEDAARHLNSVFSACVQSRDDVRKQAMLGVANNLFKIYFQLNKLRLCKNLIKTLSNKGSPPEENYPIGQRVTYKFYTGRLNMINNEFKAAEADLEFAFKRCNRNSPQNKKQILLYLIPAKILGGKMPRPPLLESYGLTQFQGICSSICSGNLREFTTAMKEHQKFFIRKGTFLIMEQTKILVYRSLFKKIASVVKDTKIPLDKFVRAFAFLGVEMEKAEVECVLANLIYSGYIRGYISHAHSTLVVAATTPFMPIASIAK